MSIESSFAPSLLSEERQKSFQQSYASSQPYRHAVINELLSDELLRKAREEIVNGLSFTEKETDIYKVNQTGDLANLDGLPEEEKSALSSLQQVRNALYSKEFRSWLEHVTGCGPLSAKKKDMSINDYTSGCHLLNHEYDHLLEVSGSYQALNTLFAQRCHLYSPSVLHSVPA